MCLLYKIIVPTIELQTYIILPHHRRLDFIAFLRK